MKKLLCSLAAFAALTFGADVTGKWTGPMEMTRNGQTRTDSAYLNLKQDGGKITGTIGPNADKQLPIAEGTVEGEAVTISADVPEGRGKFTLKLKMDGDKLKGDIALQTNSGEGFTGTLNLSKVE